MDLFGVCVCVFVWHDPKLECLSPLQSPSSTAGEKRKDRTPEEGSKVIYLRALGAALGNRQRKSPHTENRTKRRQSQTAPIETLDVKPETERNTEQSFYSFSEETAPVQSEEQTPPPHVIIETQEEENTVVTHTEVNRRG